MRTVVRTLAQALAISILLASGPVVSSPGAVPFAGLGLSRVEAQAAGNKARARELYTQGQQLFRQGDFQSAQRSFEEAYRAVPNPVVLLSIAECQVRIEDFAAAVATFRQYLGEKPNAPDRAQVESQIANLEAKPGSVSIESAPSGAVIWVDGENTGYLTPNEISVRAGKHKISLSAAGYVALEEPVEVAIGSRQRLNLTLTAEPTAAVTEEPSIEPTPTEEPIETGRGRHGTPAVWSAMAVAGVTAITGTVLGVVALKKVDEYDKNPSKSLSKKGDKLALFADVNFGIAAVAGVTALVLYLTSGSEETTERAFMVAPEISPNEVGMAGRMRF